MAKIGTYRTALFVAVFLLIAITVFWLQLSNQIKVKEWQTLIGFGGTLFVGWIASYVPKSVRATEAIKANPTKSDRAIAAELGIGKTTVLEARRGLSGRGRPPEESERIGRDGKSYSIRQRVTEDPDISPDRKSHVVERMF